MTPEQNILQQFYSKLFFYFFLLSKSIKHALPKSKFKEPFFDATLFLTCFQIMNFVSFFKLFNISYVTGNADLDFFLFAFIAFCFNCYYFLYLQKSKKVFEQKNRNPIELFLFYSYMLTSLILFII